MVALVIDDAGKKLHLLVDGKENGTAEALGENTLDKVQGTNRWLGRSLFETDAGFTGSIDELRIFDTALIRRNRRPFQSRPRHARGG